MLDRIIKAAQAVVKAAPTIVRVVAVVPAIWRLIRPPKQQAPAPLPELLIDPERLNQEPMNDLITFLKNFALSALKSVGAAVLAGLIAFQSVVPPADPVGFAIWGAITVGIRAVISALQHLLSPTKPLA